MRELALFAGAAMKACRRCSRLLPAGAFYRRGSGYRSECKDCAKAMTSDWYARNSEAARAKVRQWNANNREKVKAYRSANRRKHYLQECARKYGITPEWFDRQMALQGSSCACCKRVFSWDDKQIMSTFPKRKAEALKLVQRLGMATNRDLVEAMGVRHEFVVTLRRDLVADGLLVRHEKTDERRKLAWSLSEQGQQAVAGGPELVDIGERIRSLANKPGPARTIGAGRYAVVKRKPALPAPVEITGSNEPSGEATGAASAPKEVGIAAGYDPRYQCAPGAVVEGAGLASAGIGRYTTDARWAGWADRSVTDQGWGG